MIKFQQTPDKVFTIISINVSEFAGLTKSQMTNSKNFKVHFPGGNWEGLALNIVAHLFLK